LWETQDKKGRNTPFLVLGGALKYHNCDDIDDDDVNAVANAVGAA
jgi:hypothetical protein